MRPTIKAVALGAGITLATAAAVPAAHAATLEVHFTGMDLFMGFDGKLNIQTGPTAGDVDQLQSATFYIDGVELGTLNGDIEANVGIPGFDIPVAGGSDTNNFNGGYFSLDFDTTSFVQGWLDLDVDDEFIVTAFYTGDEIGLSLIGKNTGVKNQQPLDRLPGWSGFDEFEEIRFSFSSTQLSDVLDNGNILTQFHAHGAGTLSQDNVIPEPASLATLGLGGLALLRRRR